MEREADAGQLFEPTSPLARALAATGPHVDPIAAARDLLERMDEGEKVETLNAHPRLGERRERISPDSRAEQSGLGPTRSRELERVNEQYEGRFGFRFVVFVNRRPRAEVLAEMRSRMGRSRDHELEEGLRAVLDIAEDRLRRAR